MKRKSHPNQITRSVFVFFLCLYAIGCFLYELSYTPELPNEEKGPKFYFDQTDDNLKDVICTALHRATESITIAIFGLNDPDVLHILENKAKEGVFITILHDPVATQHIAQRFPKNAIVTGYRKRGLMHNKLICIDHKEVWLGSCNLTKEALTMQANLFVGIRSKALSSSVEQKIQTMVERKNSRVAPFEWQRKNQKGTLYFFQDHAKEGLYQLKQLIDSAKKSIRVAMFTFTHKELLDKLVQAKNRGVSVEVIFDRDSVKRTSKQAFDTLKQIGARVSVNTRIGLLHHKLLIVDNETLACGSVNWTKAAFTSNDEHLFIFGPLKEKQQKKIDYFWQRAQRESK